MKFAKKEFSYSIEEKKSKFIAYLVPYEKFDELMKRLRQEHPKARHFVYAYRYLNEFEQIVENCSDDGEPKGTSGKPTLSVLAGADIINSAVIIVRYFGGVKLGTGGLVRAYGSSVNEVLKVSQLIEYKKLIKKVLLCSYSEVSKLEYTLNKQNIQIVSKDFSDEVKFTISLSQEEWKILEGLLSREIEIL